MTNDNHGSNKNINDNASEDAQNEFASTSPPHSQPGGWIWMTRPAATFFSGLRKKERGKAQKKSVQKQHEAAMPKVEIPMAATANDNPDAMRVRRIRKSAAIAASVLMFAGVGVFGGFAILTTPAVATHIVMNTPDRVMEQSMDMNPEMLAHVLNAANIGQ